MGRQGKEAAYVSIGSVTWEWQPDTATWSNDKGQRCTNSEMVVLMGGYGGERNTYTVTPKRRPPAEVYGTNAMQLQVREFMVRMRQEMRDTPGQPSPGARMLRFRLIMQEALECTEAILESDLAKAIDGVCDLLYVTFGAAEMLGVDVQRYFDEVHRSNMLKDPDCVDEYGKVSKPPGWEPPRIADMLSEDIVRNRSRRA